MASPIMRYFEYVPADLQGVSSWFKSVALLVEAELPDGPEKSTALRKLLEGRDAAVRAALPPDPEP